MASRKPDFIVGDESDTYLKRWRLTPKRLMPLCAIYVHEFCRSDDDVPHDHPYLWNVSWILQVGYFEDQFNSLSRRMARQGFVPDYRTDLQKHWRSEGAIIWCWGWTAHRVELKKWRVARMIGTSYIHGAHPLQNAAIHEFEERIPHPVTLFFCGPRVREWGFHCPQGWRHWRQYVAPTSYGNRVGKGCAE